MSGCVDFIGKMEKWEDRKWKGIEKCKERRDFSFLSFIFGWENIKVEGWQTHLFG